MERHEYPFDAVCNGGGHGNSNTLNGAVMYFSRRRVGAIVTQGDDGHDTGKLISVYEVDPPGDKRMCAQPLASPETQPENNLLAQYRFTRDGLLADYSIKKLTIEILNLQHETPKKGAIAFRRVFGIPLKYFENGDGEADLEELRKLMDFKFPYYENPVKDLPLNGRCYGNLVIVACELIRQDAEKGFEMFRKIFSIQGEVVPVTNKKHLVLHGELTNGEIIRGESKIGNRENEDSYNPSIKLRRVYHDGELSPKAAYFLKNSYLRIISPGSSDTSIKPVLVTKGMIETLEEANYRGGRTIVIPQIMNSEGTSYQDAPEVIEDYLSCINDKRKLFTDVILTATGIPLHGERRYNEFGQTKIRPNPRGCQILLPHARIHLVDDLIEYDHLTGRVGHDPRKIGETLYNIWINS